MPESTIDSLYLPLMQVKSIRLNHCAICGRPSPLEQHHIVFRSQGKLFDGDSEVEKPTITLCGFGNNLRDSSGRYYCHGLAHHRMLHFRCGTNKELEYVKTKSPCKYSEVIKTDEWKKVLIQ